ncbi:hypothetical protein DW322_12620 [Rhodococcus rhodnii]|uniref:Gram-positive cocci surface proteins LPxTG domain-containing protein n=2 Tax=Rhodococcus rhodnii TaxID=38312 RepID=R7WSN9_9NOCA|nr:hypothetical protein [Rhodococcus rhodnii]EOM77114.1 hypothetical protein Rrhod_1581 [Rhodococcus rhodnii LMG 5362]TXG90914.1 hypothetical protein DW322_12620 [Rhodococcus rhodnii]
MRRAVVAVASAAVVLTAGTAAAQPAPRDAAIADLGDAETLCTPTDPDPRLDEISGLAVDGESLYVVGDSGSDDAVAELGPDCSVRRWIPLPVDPYDVEDLARTADGTLWFADIGDNARRRETVALISVDPATGTGTLHRLTYPDGPHDAETILMGADGVAVIVTKNLFGPSGIYRTPVPVDQLAEPGPTPLEDIGDLDLTERQDAGAALSESVFTGGAVAADGSVGAVRSYSHVHLFDLRGRDIAAALTAGPDVTAELPPQPQGEAVAFGPNGDLLVASEARGGPLPPILRIPDVVERFHEQRSGDGAASAAPPAESPAESPAAAPWVLLGGGLLAAAGSFALWRRRRS